MESPTAHRAADRLRLEKIARDAKGPPWLREIVLLLARESASIPPIEDDRDQLPEFIYRH